MEFWTTLIKLKEKPTGEALRRFKINCTKVTNDYWIMEGDTDVLRDDGIKFDEIKEGAVGPLGGLSPKELKQVCLDAYGVTI